MPSFIRLAAPETVPESVSLAPFAAIDRPLRAGKLDGARRNHVGASGAQRGIVNDKAARRLAPRLSVGGHLQHAATHKRAALIYL